MEIIPTISRYRQERMRKVQDLFDSGMKLKEIAEYFGKSVRQMQRDLSDIKALNRALIVEVNQDDILGREFRFLQELRRKAMRDYMLCREGDNAKVGYLRTALTAHDLGFGRVSTC
jgi:AraC-like DNA-binding protein